MPLSRGFESLNRTADERTHEFDRLLQIVQAEGDRYALSKWQQDFLEDVEDRWPFTPSEKQCTALREIKDKLIGG